MTSTVVQTALKRFKLIEDAESDIRKSGLEADSFRVGNQWDQGIMQARILANKPCLTIDRLSQAVRQVTNDMRMNRPSVKAAPVEDNDIETAKIYEGLIRHIQVASNADVAYDTAGDSAASKGWGYFRVVTEYCDFDSFDQDIKIKRIKNAFSVYFDPNCVEADYSDAKYAFITKDLTQDEYKHKYPKSKLRDMSLSGVGDNAPGWAGSDKVRVAEYFSVEEKDTTLYQLLDGTTQVGGDEPLEYIQKRTTQIRKVMWRLINAVEILEEREWPGKWIPIIPVLGTDIDVNGRRYLTGMIQPAMDSQRQYNYMSSAQTEAIAMAPKAPFVGAVGQFEGLETFWQTANNSNFAYLPYNPVDVNGTVLGAPQRNQAEPPVQAMVQATAKAAEDLKATTGIYDASLGARSNETSGKAIQARQREGDTANFHYVDNLSRAIRHLGVILIDLIPKIYDAPRVLRIIGEDESSKTVRVNQPLDAKGNPVDDTQEMAKIYDLTTGKYDISVEVGPSFNTKRQESSEAMLSLVQSDPSLMQKAGDLVVKNMDFPMAQQLAERLKKTMPPELQDDEENSEIPPQLKAQMAQAQQLIDQLTQQLNAAHDAIDQKQAELASKERMNAENNETKLIVEALKQETMASHALLMAELQRLAAKEQMANQREAEEVSEPLPIDTPPQPALA